VPTGLVAVDGEQMPESDAVTTGGYAVTYAENTAGGSESLIQINQTMANETGNISGVIVVNDDRELWTTATSADQLAYSDEANVTVGAIGWRETITATRTGWTVHGNGTVYAVDLEHENESVRAFTSESVRANATLDGHRIALAPVEDGFEVIVTDDSEEWTAGLPAENESTTVGELTVSTVHTGDGASVVASIEDTRVPIAERETYA
jgi:hypothetical protein